MKSYPAQSLYLVAIDNSQIVAYLDDHNNCFDIYSNKIDNYKIIGSFDELIKSNGLSLLITDSNGNPKRYLNADEINFLSKILKRKLSYSQQIKQKNHVISVNIVNIVSDLLGLNVKINPSTPYKFEEIFDINEILVSAKKLKTFKKAMINYINASLIGDRNISITYEVGERDYRISRSLETANIVQTPRLKQNTFSLSFLNGKLEINNRDIKEYQGFQKTIKF